jgi:small nuclear ribonucleoprotein (snRNP)-like protein
MASTKETNSSATRANTKPQQQTLHSQYPITSTWEVTLQNGETVKGEIYCTDPLANLIVLQDQLGDIRMVSVASILESKQLKEPSEDEVVQASSMAHNRKALEEREKRAIRLAQESILHLNPKVSKESSCKLCKETIWTALKVQLPTSLLDRHLPKDKWFSIVY